MNIEMYRLHFDLQKKHWWFINKKKIVLECIKKYLIKKEEVNILDIGCGTGLMLNELEKLGKTHGMDMSNEAISFSKEIFSGEVKQGSLPDKIPFGTNSFDLITLLDVIEHVEDDVEALQEISKRLSIGGVVVITVPAYMFLWSKFDEINEHKRRYSLKELNSKLLEAGFSVKRITYYNTLLFPVVYVVRKLNNAFNRSGESDIDMPNKFVNFLLNRIFGLEINLLKYISLPFGVSILAVVSK
jgi:2-polyprenyl-3-methyl-5-hydroxy-6-metoxy-1,4-benzoquinol methylase